MKFKREAVNDPNVRIAYKELKALKARYPKEAQAMQDARDKAEAEKAAAAAKANEHLTKDMVVPAALSFAPKPVFCSQCGSKTGG